PFSTPLAGYFLEYSELTQEALQKQLFKKKLSDPLLVMANVRARLCLLLNCEMPEILYENRRCFVLVPPTVDHWSGKEGKAELAFKDSAKKLGLTKLAWKHLPKPDIRCVDV
ncbi:hypothetical protein FRC07_008394, partial [Ceratobasidium sp. 392]